MENVTTLSYCYWAMKITALIITYRQCFNFVMTLLHRMVVSNFEDHLSLGGSLLVCILHFPLNKLILAYLTENL